VTVGSDDQARAARDGPLFARPPPFQASTVVARRPVERLTTTRLAGAAREDLFHCGGVGPVPTMTSERFKRCDVVPVHGPSSVLYDFRYAIRLLRNSPGFAAVAIATIALAIGVNTAMFSFVNGILLRPLPYPESERIVRVLERLPTGGLNGISTLNYLDWTNQNTVFEYMAAEAGWRATLTGGDEPIFIRGALVSPHYFDIFRTTPALGRTFLSHEDQPGNDHVVLLSHVLWEDRFASNPAILGRTIVLNGEAYTVIGVFQKGSPFDRAAAQIWKPLAFQPSNKTREFRWLGASAKLKPGVTLEQAQAEMDVIGRRIATAYPDSNAGWGVAVDRLADVLIGPDLHTAVTVFFAATAFVVLIGCANLANLALARSISRHGEMAVRAALGASRLRLVQQLLIENIVISVCGGIVGVGVGYAAMKWIQSMIPPSALPPAVDIRMDTSVLLFTVSVAVVTGLLFGIAPAVQTTKPSLVTALREGGQGTTSVSPGRRVRGVLVVAEIALAFVLLVGSGLLMRSFFNLLDIDPGFDATNVLTAGLPISQEQHPDPGALNAYLASIRAAVEAVPGVRTTAITSALPLQGWGYGVPYSIAGRGGADRANRRPVFFKMVSPSYFAALGIRLRAGRVLSDYDTAAAPPVALINEALAEREFAGEDPVGHRIVVQEIVPGKTELGKEIAWEIVGVIGGEKITGLGDEISAGMYVSNQQSPTYGIHLIVRTETPPMSLQKAVRSVVARVNRGQALSDVRTLEQIVDRSMMGNRVASTLLTVFAAIALVLAAVGIFGVMSYTAAQRAQEIGIRAALGASTGNLRTLIFLGGMRLTLIGLVAGFTVMFPTTDVMSSMLYGVGTYDLLTVGVVAAVLSAVAGLACFLPAWRLTNVDPMEALRSRAVL
jgi:putative ABC transport system permease protein